MVKLKKDLRFKCCGDNYRLIEIINDQLYKLLNENSLLTISHTKKQLEEGFRNGAFIMINSLNVIHEIW